MFKLIGKELRLAAHPSTFVYALLGVLVLVPGYPYSMVFIFGCLAPFITLMYGRETNDIYYTALLPLPKRDTVKAKFLFLTVTQMATILVSLPCAFLRVLILPEGNVAGIEANLAFYGLGLFMFALFNLVLTTDFFRTAYKVGRSFVLAMIPALAVAVFMEAIIHFPGCQWLDSVAPADLVRQLPILLAGLIAYLTLNPLAYRISASRFERVDL